MKEQKHPVVILHGWKVAANKYEKLKSELEERGYNVFVPDMPGNGVEPEPKKSFTLDDYADFILQYLSQNKIKECIIIGHSFGGRVGIKLAAKKPKLVKKLVLTGVPGFRVESRLRRFGFMIVAKIGKIALLFPFWPSLLGHYMKDLIYKVAGVSDYIKTEGVMRQTFTNIIGEDLAKPMRKIKCRTLLVWGENDQIVPIFVAKKMQKYIAESKLIVVPEAGHDLPYSMPNELIKSM